jgi:hypothetical protein
MFFVAVTTGKRAHVRDGMNLQGVLHSRLDVRGVCTTMRVNLLVVIHLASSA